MAIDGDWMVVSQVYLVTTNQYQAIQIFKWNGSQWIEHQEFVYPTVTWSRFGESVDISGDTIVVSAANDNGLGTGTWTGSGDVQGGSGHKGGGSVFVYRLENDVWEQEAVIPNDLQIGPHNTFGWMLRLEGDTLAVPHWNGGYVPGYVTIYNRDCTSGTCEWPQLQRLEGPETEKNYAGFGGPVALSGNNLFVGVPFIDADRTGAVFYYTRDEVGGQWTFQQSIIPSSAMANDDFGYLLAFDGETLLVPTWKRGLGHAWIFEQNSNTGEWEVTQELDSPSGTFSGLYRPSIRGDNLMIPSRAGIDVWKKTGGSWALQKAIPRSEECESTAFHEDTLAFGCRATNGYRGSVYYLTCPDAFPAAAADGGKFIYFSSIPLFLSCFLSILLMVYLSHFATILYLVYLRQAMVVPVQEVLPQAPPSPENGGTPLPGTSRRI